MTSTRPPMVAVTVVFIAVVLPASVTGNWTPWGPFSPCTKTCDGGTRYRTRYCDSPAGCTGSVGNNQTITCNTQPCVASWGTWYGWSGCSRCAQPGTRTRHRWCFYGTIRTSNGNCEGNSTDTENCLVDPCGTPGEWRTWTSTCYGCSTHGYRIRSRTCPSVCNQPLSETKSCVPDAKFCLSSWQSWGPWGLCSEECGWGTQRSTRECRPIPDRAYKCPGNVTEKYQNCITTLCGDLEKGCEGRADIVFVVDSSSSIGLENWFYVRAFVATAAKLLDIAENKTRLSVVTFSEDARLEFDLDTYFNKTLMMHAISSLPYRVGRTNTQGGLAVAREMVLTEAGGMRSDVPKIVVVITDGVSTVQQENTIPEANKLKQESNATVIVIGITEGVNEAELRGIASDPDAVVLASNFSTLASIAGEVSELTCQAVEKEGGWMEWGNWSACSKDCNHGQRIRGRDCMRGFTCDGPAYELESCNTDPCPVGPCGYRVDLALVMDSSSSIGEDQWEFIKSNVSDLLYQLDVSVNGTNVAMIRFSTWASIIFDLNVYTERDELISDIQSVPYEAGATNTQEALRLMRRGLFSGSSGGGRRGIPKVCVVITDSDSNIEPNNTIVEAQKAKDAGIYIIAVGATTEYNRTKLGEIAFDNFLVYSLENITEIAAQIAEIANLTCNEDCMDRRQGSDRSSEKDSDSKDSGSSESKSKKDSGSGEGRKNKNQSKDTKSDSGESKESDGSSESKSKKDNGSREERKNKIQSKETKNDSGESKESDGSSEESSEEDRGQHHRQGHHRYICRGFQCGCACRQGSHDSTAVWRWGYHLQEPWGRRSDNGCCQEGWGKGDSKCRRQEVDDSDSESSSEDDPDSKDRSSDEESGGSKDKSVEKKEKEKGNKEGSRKEKGESSGSKKRPKGKKKTDKKASKGKGDSEEEKKKEKDGKGSKKESKAKKEKAKEKKNDKKSSKTPSSRKPKTKKSG